MKRIEAITKIYMENENSFFILSNGLTSREAAHFHPHNGSFYLLHAMGEALSVAIGLASTNPKLRIVVIDGDGNALMGMASWSSNKFKNIKYYILRNGTYDTTGSQVIPDIPMPPDWCHIYDIQIGQEISPNPPSPDVILKNSINWLNNYTI